MSNKYDKLAAFLNAAQAKQIANMDFEKYVDLPDDYILTNIMEEEGGKVTEHRLVHFHLKRHYRRYAGLPGLLQLKDHVVSIQLQIHCMHGVIWELWGRPIPDGAYIKFDKTGEYLQEFIHEIIATDRKEWFSDESLNTTISLWQLKV